MKVASKVHLVCTVASFQMDRVDAFLRHYQSLGVDEFWITIHSAGPDNDQGHKEPPPEFEKYVADPTIHLQNLSGEFDAMLVRQHHDRLQADSFASSDWLLWADVDEFQV